jgi:NAD(P)-dependent dehydrogenase (short-subunit alcohol dehydrogenase family)
MSSADHKGVALVTGGARRIGRALALRLARDGYDIALHASHRSREEAHQVKSEIEAMGRRAVVVIADLTDSEQCGSLIMRAGALGPVTALINNASVFRADSANEFNADLWEQHFAVHARAPAQLAADFCHYLDQSRQGVIINIIDQRVLRPNPHFFSYTLSKMTLWAMTRTLAQAYAPRVRVNAVGPGPTLPNHMEGDEGFWREVAHVPLQRAVAPEEIADAVSYLVAAPSVTGQMLAVDGGQHIGWRTPDVEAN